MSLGQGYWQGYEERIFVSRRFDFVAPRRQPSDTYDLCPKQLPSLASTIINDYLHSQGRKVRPGLRRQPKIRQVCKGKRHCRHCTFFSPYSTRDISRTLSTIMRTIASDFLTNGETGGQYFAGESLGRKKKKTADGRG